jgi:hypothetical protein
MARSGTARADSGRTRLIHAVFDRLLTLYWVSAVSVQALPSCSPGSGILRAETGGRIQAQSTGERPEFGSQIGPRLANLPELRALFSSGNPLRFAGTAWWCAQSGQTGLRRAALKVVGFHGTPSPSGITRLH